MDPFGHDNPDFLKAIQDAEDYEQYLNSDEYRLAGRLRMFDTSLRIFERNFEELISSIDRYQPKTHGEALRWANDEVHRTEQQIEITRMLHNFVASVSSLIDHTRIFYNEVYEEEKLMPGYDPRITDLFKNDGLCQFIKCLRNYCVHYRTPNIIFSVKVDNTRNVIAGGPTLERDALLCYQGWKPVAKAFINASTEPIDLAAVCSEYHVKVRTFYEWFRLEQAEIQKQVE